MRSLAWSLSTSPEVTSLDSEVPVYIFWLASCLDLLWWGRRFRLSKENTRQNVFTDHLLHSRERVSCVIGDTMKKYPFWLDCTYHCILTHLRIFPRDFSDGVDIPLPVMRSLAWSLSTSPEVTSLDSEVPVYIFWLASCLDLLWWGRRFRLSKENTRQNVFTDHLLHSRERVSCVIGDTMKKYPFWLDCTYHCILTHLRIFPRDFSDGVDIPLPHQSTLFQTIPFGLLFPNVTPIITCARAHPKPFYFWICTLFICQKFIYSYLNVFHIFLFVVILYFFSFNLLFIYAYIHTITYIYLYMYLVLFILDFIFS